MDQRFYCPSCGTCYPYNKKLAGKSVKCKKCNTVFAATVMTATECSAPAQKKRSTKMTERDSSVLYYGIGMFVGGILLMFGLRLRSRGQRIRDRLSGDGAPASTPLLQFLGLLVALAGVGATCYALRRKLHIAIPTGAGMLLVLGGSYLYSPLHSASKVAVAESQLAPSSPSSVTTTPSSPDLPSSSSPTTSVLAPPDDPQLPGSARSDVSDTDNTLNNPNDGRPTEDLTARTPNRPTRPSEQPFQSLPPLGDSAATIPAVDHDTSRLIRSVLIGRDSETTFDDSAPVRGVLVGLRITRGKAFGGVPKAIQAIYQVEDRYVMGDWFGDPEGEQLEALAPPGYAVGGLHVHCGLVVTGIRAVFYRVTGSVLDANDSVTSDYLGGDGGQKHVLDMRGCVITGLYGSYSDYINSLGISFLRAELPAVVEPLPFFIYNSTRKRPSKLFGRDSGSTFTDSAPEGGILVGAILVQGTNWGGAIQAIQPVYQVGDRYVRGQMCGQPGSTEIPVLAKPGHAVAGIRLRAGLVICDELNAQEET